MTERGEEMRQMWPRSRRVHNFMPFDNWHIHSDYPDENLNVEHAGEQVKATKHWETWLCYFRKSTLILIGLMEVDRVQLPVSRRVSGESFSNALSQFSTAKRFLCRKPLLTAGAGSTQRPLLRCSFSALGDWTAAAWFIGRASSCQHNEWHLLRKLGSVWKSRP